MMDMTLGNVTAKDTKTISNDVDEESGNLQVNLQEQEDTISSSSTPMSKIVSKIDVTKSLKGEQEYDDLHVVEEAAAAATPPKEFVQTMTSGALNSFAPRQGKLLTWSNIRMTAKAKKGNRGKSHP